MSPRAWRSAAIFVVVFYGGIAALFFAARAALASEMQPYSYSPSVKATIATVQLHDVTVREGHVAVWVGVHDGIAWVQAGVEEEAGDTAPWVYVETRTRGHVHRFTRLYQADTATVEVVHRPAGWSVRVNGKLYGLVRLLDPFTPIAVSESYEPGAAKNSFKPVIEAG